MRPADPMMRASREPAVVKLDFMMDSAPDG